MPDLSVNLAGVNLRNPLIAAAGTGGCGPELAAVLPPSALGALVTKSITVEPREGNPPLRVIDLPVGMLNAVGLANPGLQKFQDDIIPKIRGLDTVVIGSIAGHCVDDYLQVAAAFDQAPELPLVELNVSCPNTEDGLQFGDCPHALCSLLREVRPVLKQTKMIVKLSPSAPDIVNMAAAAIAEGADALTLINTLPALAIDVETRQPRLRGGAMPGIGGLSGPAIHPLAVRLVHEVYRGVARDANIPLIGLGGVMRWEDAAEFILAGATAVGLGTALFVDPRIVRKITRGLDRWTARQGCATIGELSGGIQE